MLQAENMRKKAAKLEFDGTIIYVEDLLLTEVTEDTVKKLDNIKKKYT